MKSSDLHVTGIVSMFLASKYEDVIPILMRTLINKIGHNKFSQELIEEKEISIL
jgi:cyclin A